MQVHQLFNKRLDRGEKGGHGTYSGLYPTLKGFKLALKRVMRGWWFDHNKDDLEVVTYDLVEVKRRSLDEFLQE